MAIKQDNADLEKLGEGLEAVDQMLKQETSNELTLSTGVVVVTAPVAPATIVMVMEQFKQPRVPELFSEEHARIISNPMHPDYLQDMKEYQSRQGFAMYDTCLALGTTVKSVPENLPTLESEDWVDNLQALGIMVDVSKPALRRLLWMKTVAAKSTSDMERIVASVMRLTGVREEDVAKAVAGFRNNP